MALTSMTEERLGLALREHRSADFSLIYDAYAPALYGVVLRLVNDPVWAQDLLQDTLVKIWLNSGCYDPGQGRLFTWMVTIARHVAFDALRAQKTRRASNLIIGDYSEKITHPGVGQRMDHQSLLSQLAPKQRDVIELLYYQGYTGQEVATRLNLPLGTVKTRARSALHQLKRLLSRDIHYYQAA